MPSLAENQEITYTSGTNSASLIPDIGLVLSNGTNHLTINNIELTNGTNTLLFSDIYATVAKCDAIIYPAVNPTTLTVSDTIIIDDVIGNNATLSSTELSITDFSTSDYLSITPTTILIDSVSGGDTMNITSAISSITDVSGNNSQFSANQLAITDGTNARINTQLTTSSLTLSNAIEVNTLTSNNWSGSSAKINTTSDNSGTTCYIPFTKTVAGTGKSLYLDDTTGPLTYIPSTGVLTATTFNGNATTATTSTNSYLNASSSGSVNYNIVMASGLTGSTGLYTDYNGDVYYNPSTSIFKATIFNGDLLLPSTQNTAIFTSNTLYINGSALSFKNSSIVITGGSNDITALTLTNMPVGGRAYVGILNSGSGTLTVHAGLGTNIKTTNSGSVLISSGRYGVMEIRTITFNGTTVNMITTTQLSN